MGSQRMNNLIGVMQGRLLPKYKGRYQAHPVGYWQDEFPKAAELGLQQYDNLQYDAGPYVWATIIFSVKDSDVTSDFPLERLEEFVEAIHSVLEHYHLSEK